MGRRLPLAQERALPVGYVFSARLVVMLSEACLVSPIFCASEELVLRSYSPILFGSLNERIRGPIRSGGHSPKCTTIHSRKPTIGGSHRYTAGSLNRPKKLICEGCQDASPRKRRVRACGYGVPSRVLKTKKRKSSSTMIPKVPEIVKISHPNQWAGGHAVARRSRRPRPSTNIGTTTTYMKKWYRVSSWNPTNLNGAFRKRGFPHTLSSGSGSPHLTR